MNSKDWKALIGNIAPGIATALGGPVAGVAVKAVSSLILGKEDATEAELIQAAGDPALLQKWKEAEQNFSLKMEEYGVRYAEISMQSTASARDMQKVALTQDDKFAKRFIYYLASFWSIVTVIYIAFITFATIPTANQRYADTILGFLLGTIIATIMNFFLGTSYGTLAKNKQIADMAAMVQNVGIR